MARVSYEQALNTLAITFLLLRNLCPRIVCPAGGNVSSLYKVLRYAPQSSFTELVSGRRAAVGRLPLVFFYTFLVCLEFIV